MKIMIVYMGYIKRGEICFNLEQIWDFFEHLIILEACGVHFPLIVGPYVCVCMEEMLLYLIFYFSLF